MIIFLVLFQMLPHRIPHEYLIDLPHRVFSSVDLPAGSSRAYPLQGADVKCILSNTPLCLPYGPLLDMPAETIMTNVFKAPSAIQLQSISGPPSPKACVGVGSELGDYLLTSRICAGGMGEIYAAVHLRLGRDVAIKIPKPHSTCGPLFDALLQDEARYLAQVSHPSIVQVFDLRRAPAGFHYMVLELLKGRALDAVVERRGLLPISAALEVTRQVGGALAAVHHAGIVGIDLKPENVMIVDGPLIGAWQDAKVWVKLVDLGTARTFREFESNQTSKVGLGTPAYLAPELVRGKPASVATDIYCLGLLLFEIMTGENPFMARNSELVMLRQLQDHPPPLSELRTDIPAGCEIEQLVADSLAKDPQSRPPSAEAFLALLDLASEQCWPLQNRERALALPYRRIVGDRQQRVTRVLP